MTMPITFESDCSTETYTEAKEREHSRKHEQSTCVPITLKASLQHMTVVRVMMTSTKHFSL